MSSLTTTSSMEESLEEFDTRLSLGIGGGDGRRPPRRRPPPVQFDELFPPPRAGPLEGHHGSRHRDQAPSRKKGSEGGAASTRHKKARTMHGPDDGRDRRNPSDGEDAGGARKKLRLTGEQAALLEDNFRAHEILSHAQKHDLARQLSLSPRQVEVWFQNRRARTKLKQTEVDCKLLRRWCERLSDENARLRHELAEARSSAVSRLTAAAVLCPSCDKLALVGGGDMAA